MSIKPILFAAAMLRGGTSINTVHASALGKLLEVMIGACTTRTIDSPRGKCLWLWLSERGEVQLAFIEDVPGLKLITSLRYGVSTAPHGNVNNRDVHPLHHFRGMEVTMDEAVYLVQEQMVAPFHPSIHELLVLNFKITTRKLKKLTPQ